MCAGQRLFLSLILAGSLASGMGAKSQDLTVDRKFYQIVGGAVDAQTYNGFRRYHAVCNHCHGPDGAGSTVAPSLVDRLPDIEAFQQIVLGGVSRGTSVMKGFSGDPNVAPHIDDIYAYLQARADGALPRGRPARLSD